MGQRGLIAGVLVRGPSPARKKIVRVLELRHGVAVSVRRRGGAGITRGGRGEG